MEPFMIVVEYYGSDGYNLYTGGSEEDTVEALVQVITSHQLGQVRVDIEK
jgi:hypothetical protein